MDLNPFYRKFEEEVKSYRELKQSKYFVFYKLILFIFIL